MLNPFQIEPLWSNHHMHSTEYDLIHRKLHLPNQDTLFDLILHVQNSLHLQIPMALLLQSSMYTHCLNVLGMTLQVG